jgi:hypothetical protein
MVSLRDNHKIEKVRASRDGHEYHEAWTARMAMRLLWPNTPLVAIAVEGLSPSDQSRASAETTDIADITLYYGHTTFEGATRAIITQFKYSEANKNTDFRASDAKKTIAKFAKTYRDYEKQYGAGAAKDKLDFELITNRPIYEPLRKAIEALAKGMTRTGEAEEQSKQFKRASGFNGKSLVEFASKFKAVGLSGSLPVTKNELAGLIVDWSGTSDPLAAARLGQLRQIVRDKAGHAGTNQNLIKRADILAALNVGDADELLPCKSAIPEVGEVVVREQLSDAVALVSRLTMPLLIHAAGGVGKTVFMTSLAGAVSEHSEVVFFDCFGGGAYRSPADARHLPAKGLVHIANTLAFRGLCDPILPGGVDVQSLLGTFQRRLVQCVNTLNRAAPGRELTLFIDAIDNAKLFARERNEESFPELILESFHHEPIPGVKLIVSCRTERRPSTYARYQEFPLSPFSINETTAYLRARLTDLSEAEINVAQARSGGNPRVLDYLVKSNRGLLDQSEIHQEIVLNDLIQQRISDALSTTIERGYAQQDINAFLAGLAVLPPPVPLDEYANALGIQLSEIESFAADLRPLLERTNQGLMFRDEPTETLVRDRYASSEETLKRVATNLLARQDTSVYAARSLPALLHKLDDGEQLFNLAFDERIPITITSTVGKHKIRNARITSAVLHAAIKRDYNRLVQLLLELSTLATVDQRGAQYILDFPDLVVAAQDVDATRRLFETRPSWPGTRHARLAIANSLSGESEEAYRHAIAVDEWIDHYRRTDHQNKMDRAHPARQDIAAIPFILICKGRPENAARFLQGWQAWYAYEICEYIFDHFHLATSLQPVSPLKLAQFVSGLDQVGPLTAALSFDDFRRQTRKDHIVALSKACTKATDLRFDESYRTNRTYQLQDGLRKASALALSLGLVKEALAISLRVPHQRPGIWSMRDTFHHNDVFPFVFRTALAAAAQSKSLYARDVLPKELIPITSGIKKNLSNKEFRDKLKERLPKFQSKQADKDQAKQRLHTLSYDEMQEVVRFIDQRLDLLLTLTQALSHFLAAPRRRIDRAFVQLVQVWEDAQKPRDPYSSQRFDNFFRMLGLETALFALWSRSDLKIASIRRFLEMVDGQDFGAHVLIQIVSMLAKRESLHVLAGEQALTARTLIEREDDVTLKASLCANLARAILPASLEDASTYFRDGLEQMDAIGSGDYEFTNELLLFSSGLKGNELDEVDYHTLTNICELNMGGEPEKFFWGAFGRGMSKAAGARGLAKLTRWDDRSKIFLKYTLLPYLTALVDDGKIGPELALTLNRLANPVEYFESGTTEFAKAIQGKVNTNRPDIISELIEQFEDDNPGVPMDTTVGVLASLAGQTFGKESEMTAYLTAAQKCFANARHTTNDHMNYGGKRVRLMDRRVYGFGRSNREVLRVLRTTDPLDQSSLTEAINLLNGLEHGWNLKDKFLASLRDKVPFKARTQYARNICALEQLNFHWKIMELKMCKECWKASSASLADAYRKLAIPLIQLLANELANEGRFSSYNLREVSDLTGVAAAELVLELIKVFARPDSSTSGAVWLAFGRFVLPEADNGQGQLALKRMLGGDAAKLANNVIDGPWQAGLYPQDDVRKIVCGLVWRMLGSPYAKDRWRATHSVRCLARFGGWDIINSLVDNLSAETAGPFQARELAFYFLHAKLWLLIALARLALDYPREISRHKDALLQVATEEVYPHVLMRHFAARALVACIDSGNLTLPTDQEDRIRSVDLSPHPRLRKRIREGPYFNHTRPDSFPEPKFKFRLDYDFREHEVDNLSQIFGKPRWEVEDMISEIVQQVGPDVSDMYAADGRDAPHQHSYRGMTTSYHTRGQQMGWHALFFVAGRLLKNFPVTDDWWYKDDPWGEWLGRYTLTRDDGFWLSDGTDRTPLDTVQILLKKAKDSLVLTGDRNVLLELLGATTRVSKQLIVEGSWYSADGIRIRISSVLVNPAESDRLARKLTREEPMRVWVPTYSTGEENGEDLRNEKTGYTPWIVCPSGEAHLDEEDPFGVPCANLRPYISRQYRSALSLTRNDPFGRKWKGKLGTTALRAEAWGREETDGETGPHPGLRLSCSASSLREILKSHDRNLLLLISLQRYEKGSYRSESKFTNTVAVVTVSKTLDLKYFKGHTNYLHKSRF